jgi:hypothetical protein
MALRPIFDADAAGAMSQRLNRFLSRIYVLWLLGNAIGALKLKANTFNFLGASFALERPDLIEGILYFGCLCLYIVILWNLITTPFMPISHASKRRALYYAVRNRRRTLIGKSRSERQLIKFEATVFFRMQLWIGFIGLTMPLLHIIIFRREPLWSAIVVMMTRAS